MSVNKRYPKRNEYGDSSPRCEWCGKPTGKSSWGSSEYGTWCSFECSSAGRYSQNIFSLIALIVVLVVSVAAILFENISYNPPMIYWWWIFIPIVLISPFALCLTIGIVTGARVIRADEEARHPEALIESEEELTPRHHLVLDFVAEIPTNEGMTRKQILDHMRSKGVPISLTKVTVNELVGSGYLEEVSIGRYVPGQVQRRHRT